jgi:hypothetical protein
MLPSRESVKLPSPLVGMESFGRSSSLLEQEFRLKLNIRMAEASKRNPSGKIERDLFFMVVLFNYLTY